jgi:hypothetical protein
VECVTYIVKNVRAGTHTSVATKCSPFCSNLNVTNISLNFHGRSQSVHSFDLKMETSRSLVKAVVIYQATRRHIP